MKYKITPPVRISSSIALPSSKSISNRVLIINALSGNKSAISNLADCDDTKVMRKSLSPRTAGELVSTTDVHGAGTAMRFLTAYYSLTAGTHIITGSERMQTRPIHILVDSLRSLGANIDYERETGYPPLRIKGGSLRGGYVQLPANVSSQYISALLMISPYLCGGLQLELTGKIASAPYINMTMSLMTEFGAKVAWTGDNTIVVEEGGYIPRDFEVECDWSAASYWYEIVMLSNNDMACVTLDGLCAKSIQGDSRVSKYFEMLGVVTRKLDNGLIIEKQPSCKPDTLSLYLGNEPDLAQTLIVACVAAGVKFEFGGLANLRIKETDRLAALSNEMRKMGYVLRYDDNGYICWKGEVCEPDKKPVIETYDDHRMAMSIAPMCLQCGELLIDNPQVVQKSYPNYWDDLSKAGFKMEEVQ